MPELTQCPVRQIPALDSVADFETLKNLVFFRESEELNAMKCRDNRVTSPTQSVWGVPLSVSLVILECKEFGASSIQDGECGLDADMIWNAFVVENVTIPCS